VRIGDFSASSDFLHFVGDGLMAIFFLFVGLELKRESVEGPFQNPRQAALPLCGALGGMLVPALIYLAIVLPVDPALSRGWAIPAATDIAFAIGMLSLLGSRAPHGLRLFLLAVAIIDDLGAILVIAVFYTDNLHGWALGGASVVFIAMLLLNRMGVTRLAVYWALGLLLWYFVASSGMHATVAGVLTALTVPMRRPDGGSPLLAAEHELKPWVQCLVLPLFALAYAGAPLGSAGLSAAVSPVSLAVIAGLVLGKPLGLVAGTLVGAKLFARAPPVRGLRLVGVSMFAGIGFTMSLFIGALAFGDGPAGTAVRLGVLIGSLLSAAIGLGLLFNARVSHEDEDPNLVEQEAIAQKEGVFDER
jgi:NhaA family Na+:H+ antiporter